MLSSIIALGLATIAEASNNTTNAANQVIPGSGSLAAIGVGAVVGAAALEAESVSSDCALAPVIIASSC
ncbi:hypothetical protein DASB73_014050 [Starmerella bacillaris]|uniref:Uncharacterized protein n=1 Tax=Starmerella bacillaris TaxID=1247836 RepID=A0AAV5RGW4_STABA|nr:hypothetical protein DASB73_014050 [Starmerella bacillaris]